MRQVLDHDEFSELVEGEVKSEKVTSEAGHLALEESKQIDLSHHESRTP